MVTSSVGMPYVAARLVRGGARCTGNATALPAQPSALLSSELGAFCVAHYEASLRRCALVEMEALQGLAVQLLGNSHVLQSLRQRLAL